MLKNFSTKMSLGDKKSLWRKYVPKAHAYARVVARNSFLVTLVLLSLDVAVGQWLLHTYLLSAKTKEPEAIFAPTVFHEEKYRTVLERLSLRGSKFQDAQRPSSDPFQ